MTARSDLGTLEASGLIQVASLEPELEYLFRHALVQDAAYSSLLKQDRRVLHRLAAESLLSLYPDRKRELAGVVALHFEQAGETATAAEHLVLAGEYAVERFANREALSFFERAKPLLPPDHANADLRLRAAIGSARVGWSFNASSTYIDELEAALGRDGERADRSLIGDAYFWIAFLRRWRGERPDTSAALRDAIERAAQIGEEVGDPIARAVPKAFLGVGRMMNGELREGARETREALALMEGKGDALSQAILSGFLTMTYARLGEFAEAERSLAQGERLAERGDEIAKLDTMIARTAIDLERGDLDASMARGAACALRSEELGAVACAVPANILLGSARLARGDALGAKVPVERGLELSQFTDMATMRTLARGLFGAVQGHLGDLPAATADWDEALAAARAAGDHYGEAMTLWNRGRTNAREGAERAAALADLQAAARELELMEARPALARVLRDEAGLLTALGNDADAAPIRARSDALGRELGLRDFR